MVCIWAQFATGWFSKLRSRFCTWGPESRTLKGAHRRILSTSVWMGQPPRGLSKAKLNKRTPVYIFWTGKLGFRLNIGLQFEQCIQKSENCLSWIPRHVFIQRRVRFEENTGTENWEKRVGIILGGRWNRRLVCRVQEPQPRTTAWQHQPWCGWHRGERPVRTHNHRNPQTRSWKSSNDKKKLDREASVIKKAHSGSLHLPCVREKKSGVLEQTRCTSVDRREIIGGKTEARPRTLTLSF